jgi:hypothetical protein
MAAVSKINSNVVETAFAEETSIKTLPGTPVWYPLDVNSFADFGGSISKVTRTPFRTDRQNRKGSTVDLDAAGSINHDLVQEGLQTLLQGFFFADLPSRKWLGRIQGRRSRVCHWLHERRQQWSQACRDRDRHCIDCH